MDDGDYVEQLREVIGAHDWLMGVLAAVRACDPPDWLVGAGVLRSLVWDHLHGYVAPTPLADVDVAFFDADDLRPERDQEVERCLRARRPDVPWEATNQAAVHLWYPWIFGTIVEPLHSSAEAIETWPETATCIGVRLLPDDDLLIVAPYGLVDLFQMVHRRNPRRVTLAEYRRRLEQKQIVEKWPRVRIIDG
jgi:uncharacterized protein